MSTSTEKSQKRELAIIAEEIRACTACGLHQTRTQAVPGSGAADAALVFIGEAPGAQEDQQGVPFVGQAGKLLDQHLARIGVDRQDVYIANVLKCRPPDNRPPRKGEIAACSPYLARQLDVIRPQVVVTLGRFPLNWFCSDLRITQVHGQVQQVDGWTIYPVYHPAAAFRRNAWREALARDFERIPQLLQ